MLPNIVQMGIFWLVQASAVLVVTVPFRWPLLALWAAWLVWRRRLSRARLFLLVATWAVAAPFLMEGGLQGLLGLTFHPDYRKNGEFFIFYTDNGVFFGDKAGGARWRCK